MASQPFEQRVFDLSPVGVLPTMAGIFARLFLSFEGAALLRGSRFSEQFSLNPSEGAGPAAVLSLMAAVALGMQRYARLKDREEAPALQAIMPCWVDRSLDMPDRGRLLWGTLGGAILGAAATLLAVPGGLLQRAPLIFLWFVLVMAFVGMLFGRGSIMTRIAARNFAQCIDHDLKIDLLRIDQLSLIGRSSARTALIWFTVAAVICLFFVSGHAPLLVVGTVALSAGMGLWIFFKPLERIHGRIREAKRAELDRVRHAIADARAHAADDHEAAARLHGLLSFEARIERVHEWPFDQVTLLRVGTYVLIPAVPWFGEAIVSYFVQRLIH